MCVCVCVSVCVCDSTFVREAVGSPRVSVCVCTRVNVVYVCIGGGGLGLKPQVNLQRNISLEASQLFVLIVGLFCVDTRKIICAHIRSSLYPLSFILVSR